MCGILGWLRSPGESSERELRAAADLIAHRGPDDRGTYEDTSVGLALGHNRLSIIDLSAAGHQPMRNEDDSVVLVFNGEIYNFRELRDQLVSAGHTVRSKTDSEVLVHGYEEWGDGLVERLCGMFAFAIWDPRRRRLFLARDPMGIKPLYYWHDPRIGFHFASEIKAFLALEGFRAELDKASIQQFLRNSISSMTYSPRVWQASKKCRQGHALSVPSPAVCRNSSSISGTSARRAGRRFRRHAQAAG